MIRILSLLLALACSPIASSDEPAKKKPAPKKQKKVNPALVAVEDVEGLPRVLLIGDSISIGYTVPTRKILEGKVNLHRPLVNCGPTTRGIESIEAWLETGGRGKSWDLIHFNWGLHDLKYMGPNGENLADPKAETSKQQVPPEEYRKNLVSLVESLQKTGAKLIWRNTTPVPEGAKGRVVEHSIVYNEIAAEIMARHNIPIHDLHGFTTKQLATGKEIMLPKGNVHYSREGSEALGADVARVVLEHLVK